MFKVTTAAFLAILATLLLIGACGNSGQFVCPTLSDNVTWTSYGSSQFQHSGDDGTARNCVSQCGWHVFQGNNGGIGTTLQVATPGEEVVFAWAYNNMAGFRVKRGWTGATDKGARLGDSIASFQTRYPDFVSIAANQLASSDANTSVNVTAFFDQNGLLTDVVIP